MKILLVAVNAKYIHSNPALYSLRAYAGTYAEQVELLELTINHYPDDILQEIFRRKPDVVAFSCYIWNLSMIERILGDLPKILPQTQIWMGGPEVSYDAPEFLEKHPQVCGVMVGEGEETFKELAAYYVDGVGSLADIAGLVRRADDRRIYVNAPRSPLDMNQIPFLYQDMKPFAHRIVYYESSRGCPFSCSYCLSSIDKRVRFRDPKLVVKELQYLMDQGVPQVKFVDRTFNCSHTHALTIWRYLKEHDNGTTNFHFEIAADLLNEEELSLLNSLRPGLVQLEIGVQSTNPETIREIDRVMDFEQLTSVVRRVQQGHNIHQHLDLIVGLPKENYESFCRSFDDVYRLHPDQLQLGFLKVLKGSKMHRKAEEYELCYHTEPVYEVFCTRWISYEEVLRLKAVEEMVEVYYNSGQFMNAVICLEKEFSTPFAMFAYLADYYEAHDLNGKNHSRQARFEILLDAISQVAKERELYRELLTLDVYLREKSKSRPAWARNDAVDEQSMKETILRFYKKEEQERRFLPGYESYSAKQMMHMTHLERFSYDVLGDKSRGEHCLLFDYRRRDPLNGNAAVTELSYQDME
ncbi:MAG: B12-binding domain-containing radical SAM protein [Eubacteriales bacterium]|nr:B12-binding domain-containing radical SAM protein [Eubacteriales bacterium]